ncbi:hypothetical protein [Nostoc sp.]|uniref:hypothetical protein n=1 Tax=Nostoc sp. TaxID=1180 RepID=UPI003FA5C540
MPNSTELAFINGVMANIHSSAVKAGIVIEESKQPIRGSPQEKAKELAIAAYHSREIN